MRGLLAAGADPRYEMEDEGKNKGLTQDEGKSKGLTQDEGKNKGLTQDARTAERIAVSKMEGCWASTPFLPCRGLRCAAQEGRCSSADAAPRRLCSRLERSRSYQLCPTELERERAFYFL